MLVVLHYKRLLPLPYRSVVQETSHSGGYLGLSLAGLAIVLQSDGAGKDWALCQDAVKKHSNLRREWQAEEYRAVDSHRSHSRRV